MTKKDTDHKSSLRLRAIELLVHLGWEEEERDQQQVVQLDVLIQFDHPPLACKTDELADTFCYATLISELREHIEDQPFKLIEHLTQRIYQFIKTKIPHHQLLLHLTKHPSVEGLSGGVTFTYGDKHA